MLCRHVNLSLYGIDELIQITTGSELDMGGSRFRGFEGGYRRIVMVISAEIFDLSRLSLFCRVMQICKLTLSGIDELIQITVGSESGMGRSRFCGFEGGCRSMDMVCSC